MIHVFMHFSCASACILPLCHLHGPDVAGGTGNAQMHRTCSAGAFEYDPESKPLQVDMSDNTNIANANGPSMSGSSFFGKIKNSFVGLRRNKPTCPRYPCTCSPLPYPPRCPSSTLTSSPKWPLRVHSRPNHHPKLEACGEV